LQCPYQNRYLIDPRTTPLITGNSSPLWDLCYRRASSLVMGRPPDIAG